MKLAAIVLSYEIQNAQLLKNVIRYVDNVDVMILWDNTPKEKQLIDIKFWHDNGIKVTLLSTGKNEGIGYALNRAILLAKEQGCTHLLTMDQDSIWRDFVKYREEVEANVDDNVAIFAPTIADAENEFVYTCNKTDQYAITSGSIVNLDIAFKIGLFNEKFFIDEVDNEYCVRAVKNGFHIKVYDNCFLYQHFGEKGKSLFGKTTRGNYSPQRVYFQVRNRIWMWRLYPKDLSIKYHLRTLLVSIMLRCWNVLWSEEDKFKKLVAVYRGIHDGLSLSPQ